MRFLSSHGIFSLRSSRTCSLFLEIVIHKPPARVFPYRKGRGCSSEILKRTPKRYQGPVLWAWLESVFTPQRDSTIQHISSCHIVAQYPKRYRKSSQFKPFEAKHTQRYENRIFNPENINQKSYNHIFTLNWLDIFIYT